MTRRPNLRAFKRFVNFLTLHISPGVAINRFLHFCATHSRRLLAVSRPLGISIGIFIAGINGFHVAAQPSPTSAASTSNAPIQPPAPDTASRSAASPKPASVKFTLKCAERWLLASPHGERYDASGLLFLPDHSLLTVNDRGKGIERIQFRAGTNVADLVPAPTLFSTTGLYSAEVPPPKAHDLEGLALDGQGRIYVSEESRRRVLRFDPATGKGEVLPIDWTPVRKYFDSKDSNASFEGIAVGGDTLYVANERSVGRIIAVDLNTFQIRDHFQVHPIDRPARDVHYSDLSWFDGHLWVLCRESHCVLRVDPATRKVIAEFDYSGLELTREMGYLNPFPGYGFFEGLAVDATNIWLAIDNNGFPRLTDSTDHRPSLYRCPRPDVSTGQSAGSK